MPQKTKESYGNLNYLSAKATHKKKIEGPPKFEWQLSQSFHDFNTIIEWGKN